MEKETRKLITIVTESALESDITEALERLGAAGYTITNARGKGSRGVREAGWTSDSNIRVEIICSDLLAEQITDLLQEKYYDHYAMVVFESEVRVLRPGKFV